MWCNRKPRVTPPSQAELDALPVKDRQELHDAHRQRPWQMATSLGVVLSVVFTAGGLIYTGRTWETSQETQITDRYTKAVEQLGSKTPEVRLGGLYALNRIAADSEKDASTIQNVMAAFARNRDLCTQRCVPLTLKNPVTASGEKLQVPTDVRAALELAASLKDATGLRADLAGVYFREAELGGVALTGADLTGADLTGTALTGCLSSDHLVR